MSRGLSPQSLRMSVALDFLFSLLSCAASLLSRGVLDGLFARSGPWVAALSCVAGDLGLLAAALGSPCVFACASSGSAGWVLVQIFLLRTPLLVSTLAEDDCMPNVFRVRLWFSSVCPLA